MVGGYLIDDNLLMMNKNTKEKLKAIATKFNKICEGKKLLCVNRVMSKI